MTADESLLVSHLAAQLNAFGQTVVDRQTIFEIASGWGHYGAVSMRESLDTLCEDHGWQWESESRLFPTSITITRKQQP